MSTPTSNGTQNPAETGIERLEPLYLAPGFEQLIGHIVAQKIFRVEIGAGRHYRNEADQTFKSITTFLDDVMPTNRFLQKWRESKIEELGTVQGAKDFVQATADFGTGLHIAVAEFCRTGRVDWLEFEAWAFDYLGKSMNLANHTLHAGVEELTRDFAAMLQFLFDYEVKVMAVEIPVFSRDGYATLIDLVVDMNDKKYTEATPPEKRKRIFAGINLKSGKKGFFDAHLFQLIGERRAFNETYGAAVCEMVEVFNLAPTDWLKEPNYKIARQTAPITERNLEAQFDLFVALAKERGVLGKPSKTFHIFEGVTEAGKSPCDALVSMDYDAFTKRRLSRVAI